MLEELVEEELDKEINEDDELVLFTAQLENKEHVRKAKQNILFLFIFIFLKRHYLEQLWQQLQLLFYEHFHQRLME